MTWSPEDIDFLKASGAFDATWYLREYPDVAQIGMDPVEHYVRFGALLRRRPAPAFDTDYYLATYRDVARDGTNPFVHYLKFGAREGRHPAPPAAARPKSKPAAAANGNGVTQAKAMAATRPVGAAQSKGVPANGTKGAAAPATRARPMRVVPLHEASAAGAYEVLGEYSATHVGPALLIPDVAAECRWRGSLAVHLHLFHLDMAEHFRHYLAQIPCGFSLYISVPPAADVAAVRGYFAQIPEASQIVVEAHANAGRDLGPMFVGFAERLRAHDLILHLHSKRSGHTPQKRDWGAQLVHHLLHSRSHAAQLLNLFADRSGLGLVFPVYHPSVEGQIVWGGNFKRASTLAARMGQRLHEADLVPFPAGSFFVARSAALKPLFDAALTLADFDAEADQIDGTLAHALERMMAVVSARQGYANVQVRAEKTHTLSTAYLKGAPYRSPRLARDGEGAPAPAYALRDAVGLRVAIYSCATGGYDRPLPFEAFVEGASYYFVADEPLSGTGFWKPLQVSYVHRDPVKTARYHKCQPHRVLPDCDIAVWLDANVSAVGDIAAYVDAVVRAGACFGVFPHPYRASFRDEAAKIVELKYDQRDVVAPQVERYEKDGYTGQGGLTETNFMVMDLRQPATRATLDLWWGEIDRHSRRDQLSFDYARWKTGATAIALTHEGLSIRANAKFAYFKHGAPHPYAGAFARALERAASADDLRQAANVAAPQAAADRSGAAKTVDVIVCIHNSPRDVEDCLASLAAARDDRTRLILVDDGSAQETRDVIDRHCAQHPQDLLIRHESALGYTKSANAGLRRFDRDYAILLNSDTIVPPGWVATLVRAGESAESIGILGPLSNAASWQSVPEVMSADGDFAVNRLPENLGVADVAAICATLPSALAHPTPVVNGFCFAIKRAVIDRIGYLDEEGFPQGYGEENDYCFRAVDAGFQCAVTTGTYVFHAKSKSFSHERRKVLSAAGMQALLRKHSKQRVQTAVDTMRAHPALIDARRQFAARLAPDAQHARAICFYLPQFHPFEINDRAWGAGFTEWTNVVKARPRFPGHEQPKMPGALGFYDLRLPATLAAQAELAQRYDVEGFCIYYYRFGGERVMWQPIQTLLSTPSIPLRFCLSWANEDWTRAWDGKTRDLILKQDYADETLEAVWDDMLLAARDPRYIRIEGRPLFMVYQLNKLPVPERAIARLRERCQQTLGVNPVIGTTYNDEFKPEFEAIVDLVVQFPPHRTPRKSKRQLLAPDSVGAFEPQLRDSLESYEQVVTQALESTDMLAKLHPGVCPDWDNSPRRARSANILVGSSPQKFAAWVKAAAKKAMEKHADGRLLAPIVFVNAWNEWAEGATMEPSERWGAAYLEALKEGLTGGENP